MSLKYKLAIIFLIIAITPLVFVSYISFSYFKKNMDVGRIAQLESIVSYKTQLIESYFDDFKTKILIMQSFYNIKKNLPILIQYKSDHNNPEMNSAKKMLDLQLPEIQKKISLFNVMLVSPEAEIVYSSDSKNLLKNFLNYLPIDADDKAFMEGKNKIFISDIFVNKVRNNLPSIFITAPAFDFNEKFIGVIVFEVDMTSFYNLIQETTGLGKTGETLIGKKDGNQVIFLNTLRHDPKSFLLKKILINDMTALPLQKAVQGENGSGESIDYRGKKVVAAWRHIPSLNWGIVSKIDLDEAFKDVIKLRNLIFIVLITAIIFVTIIIFIITYSITEPIKKLTIGAEIIGSGNLDYSVGTKELDEIGVLSRSFDKMSKNLKEITASRNDLNKEIKERKLVENELRSSNEKLELYAYVASHDLQEPLRMMSSFSELLKKRYADKLDKDANDFIEFIIIGATRMQSLINDLLTYSRVGNKNQFFEKINCNSILTRIINMMAISIKDNNASITHDDLPEVIGHQSDFIQLFQNFISNAIKFKGNNSPKIHISAKKENSEWVFSIKDNGIGIDSQHKKRIFLLFQRLHSRNEYPGTGIGLAICKKIVENWNGRIWVDSEPGIGSVFYFTMPII